MSANSRLSLGIWWLIINVEFRVFTGKLDVDNSLASMIDLSWIKGLVSSIIFKDEVFSGLKIDQCKLHLLRRGKRGIVWLWLWTYIRVRASTQNVHVLFLFES